MLVAAEGLFWELNCPIIMMERTGLCMRELFEGTTFIW